MKFVCREDSIRNLLKPIFPGAEISNYEGDSSYKQDWQIFVQFIVTRADEDAIQRAFQTLKKDNPKAKVIFLRAHLVGGTYFDDSLPTAPDGEIKCLINKREFGDGSPSILTFANPDGLAKAMKQMMEILESGVKDNVPHHPKFNHPLIPVDKGY